MRKKALYISMAALAACACHNTAYTISGETAASEGTMYLIVGGETADSAAVTDGTFQFKGEAATPAYAYITDGADAGYVCQLFLEPGDILIRQDEEHMGPYAEGTVSNDAQKEFDSWMNGLDETYTLAAESGAPKETLDSLIGLYEDKVRECVEKNIGNMFGLASLRTLAFGDLSAEEIAEYLSKFPKDIQGSSLYARMKEENDKAMLTAAGQDFIDFTQENPDSGQVTLSDVLSAEGNRYVLLDFWASWCGPCMGEVPYLVKTYAAYHDKGFEILGVSLDDNKDDWMHAVKTNGMDWIHVSDLQGWANAAAVLYGINSIPANFLIDCRNGKIIDKSLRGEAVEARIAELLGPDSL